MSSGVCLLPNENRYAGDREEDCDAKHSYLR